MKKVIVIIGPTAVGKSKIGIILAKKLNTEIISGDSVQVYKELNIGSAKITNEEMQGVKHHLIDILDPTEEYSVFDFQKESRKLIEKLDIPLIVGGTGLYIKSAISNYEFDAKKRDKDFDLKYENYSNEELYELLNKLDLKQTEVIHPNNRKRTLRAIEAALDGQKLSDKIKKDEYLYDAYIVYLNVERSILYDRINKRVDMMFALGLENEVKALYDKGITPHAIGYQEFIPYFKGEATIDEVKEEIKKATRHLAKRQMTWFKNQMNTHFYEVNLDDICETASNIYLDVKKFLER